MTKIIIYVLCQWTWGILQTAVGAVVFFLNRKNKHFKYGGAVVTAWKQDGGISLGRFIFLPEQFIEDKELLVHEYGHTVQSLALGPMYLLIIGIPSIVWAQISYFQKYRIKHNVSYYSFYTESWANLWGEKVTKEKALRD